MSLCLSLSYKCIFKCSHLSWGINDLSARMSWWVLVWLLEYGFFSMLPLVCKRNSGHCLRYLIIFCTYVLMLEMWCCWSVRGLQRRQKLFRVYNANLHKLNKQAHASFEKGGLKDKSDPLIHGHTTVVRSASYKCGRSKGIITYIVVYSCRD